MKTSARAIFCATALAVAVLCAEPAAAQYAPTDLGAPAGGASAALAVNEAGLVAGVIYFPTGENHAALFTSAGFVDLGGSIAYDINDAGTVVGLTANVDGYTRAFVWTGGVMTELAPLPGDYESYAVAINNAGVVVGYSVGDFGPRAVRWVGGIPSDLDVPGFASQALGINDAGVIVGQVFTTEGTFAGFTWTNGSISELAGPGGDCGPYAIARAINASGVVAGAVLEGDCGFTAVRWIGGIPQTAGPMAFPGGTVPPYPAINDGGIIAGARPAGCGSVEAVLYDGTSPTVLPGLTMFGPCSPGEAWGINNKRVVVGYSYGSDGFAHATLWREPVKDTTPPSITVTTSTGLLWPPNGKMVPIGFTGTITDDGSGVASVTWKIVDEYGRVQPSGTIALNGDGSFSLIVPLESKRDGKDKDGRKYTLTVTATDNAGNSTSSSSATVVVHDQGK